MIVSNNNGGLCNRIRCLVSCMRFAKKNKIVYKVYWEILNSYTKHVHILNCSFENLFSNKIEIKNISKTNIYYKHHCMIIFEDDNIPVNFNNFNSKCNVNFIKFDKLNRNIDFMYNKIPEKIKKDYINCFKVLKPINNLQKKIDNFSKKFNDKTVSVHIRTWNRNGEESRKNYLFNIQKFENEMFKYKNNNFFIATDSQEVKEYFKNISKLKNKITFYPRQTNLNTSRDFMDGVQEDLIELYLLSKNKIIIGSHFSTFTETAWWLAGCPKNITIL